MDRGKVWEFLKTYTSFYTHNPTPSLYPFLSIHYVVSIQSFHLIHRIIVRINFNSMCKHILCQCNTLNIMPDYNCLEESYKFSIFQYMHFLKVLHQEHFIWTLVLYITNLVIWYLVIVRAAWKSGKCHKYIVKTYLC